MSALDIITRREPLKASTWDSEAWTFEAVLATGTPVERFDSRGTFNEILSLSQTAWPDRVPLLDSHNRESVDRQIGYVDNLQVVGGDLRGRVTLSRHNAQAQRIAAELSDGHTFGVSIGYSVSKWSERKNSGSGRREKIATAWTLMEASLVVIPADHHAGIRGTPMTVKTDPALTPEETAAETPPETTATASEDNRAAVNTEIRSIARVASLPQEWIDRQIDGGASVEEARAAAFEAMKTRTAKNTEIRNTRVEVIAEHDDIYGRGAAMGEALYQRINPGHTPSERARAYVGLTIPDMARDSLRARGIITTGLSAATVIERALGGMHLTSDFPIALGDVVGRTLRDAYKAAPSGIRQFGRKTTSRDFRAKHRIQLSSAPTLEKVNEGGEFTHGTLAEAKESYQVDTFGRIIAVSRQILVNDDLGAFFDFARPMGQAAAAFEAKFLVDLVTTASGVGPTMNDGKALFHAGHGNLDGTGAPPNVTSLTSARTAMRRQKGLANEPISVTPKYLLVPPELETAADQLVAAITAAKTDDVNPFTRLVPVVEPRLADTSRWYVVADPAEIDGLEYAYLEGQEGPQTITEPGFDVDGLRVRVRLDFGAGFVDWRGWYTNPGAAE